MWPLANKKQAAKRKLTEEGISNDKVLNRSAYKTATRPQGAAPEAGSLDVMFSSIGALMSAEAKRSQSEEVKMRHEASLLNIESRNIVAVAGNDAPVPEINSSTDGADS